MSPEKERRLVEAAQAYEAAVHKARELQEKRDKLRDSMNAVQTQLEQAADQVGALERAMFKVVAEDLPPMPNIFTSLQKNSVDLFRTMMERGAQIGTPSIARPIGRVHDLASAVADSAFPDKNRILAAMNSSN